MARRAVAIYREKKGFVDQVYTQKVKRAIIKHLVFTGKISWSRTLINYMGMWSIFKDKNDYNEKSIIGFCAFAIMVLFAIFDLATGFW